MDLCSLRRKPSAGADVIWIAVLIGVSGISTLTGMAALSAFNQTAGPAGSAPGEWPRSSSIQRATDRKNLMVFVHPYCPCSVATVSELATLGADGQNRATTVLFYRPKNSGWEPGSLWNKVREEIPGARIVWDDDGQQAAVFGAKTSGYTLLYGSSGEQLFKGGVTGSRGHAGDNYGIERLRAALTSGRRADRASLVFGCSLTSSDATSERRND